MSYRNVFADDQRITLWVIRRLMRDMQDTAILNICACTNLNKMHIATHCDQRPDPNIVSDSNIANHHA